MGYLYTHDDLDIMSWQKIDELIEKIYCDLKIYLNKSDLKIKYISPILRGGAIPTIKLSHMLNVIDMLPIQLKYNNNNIDLKIGLDYIKDSELKTNECILLVEGNHVTGTTSNIAVNLLREKFGYNIKIIYVSLTRDYTYRNSVKNVCYSTWGELTNESKQLSEKECNQLKINYKLVSVYPWENVQEELMELNHN